MSRRPLFGPSRLEDHLTRLGSGSRSGLRQAPVLRTVACSRRRVGSTQSEIQIAVLGSRIARSAGWDRAHPSGDFSSVESDLSLGNSGIQRQGSAESLALSNHSGETSPAIVVEQVRADGSPPAGYRREPMNCCDLRGVSRNPGCASCRRAAPTGAG